MKVHLTADRSGGARLLIEGADFTRYVLADDFEITLRDHMPLVHLTLRPDELTADVEALVEMARVEVESVPTACDTCGWVGSCDCQPTPTTEAKETER